MVVDIFRCTCHFRRDTSNIVLQYVPNENYMNYTSSKTHADCGIVCYLDNGSCVILDRGYLKGILWGMYWYEI